MAVKSRRFQQLAAWLLLLAITCFSGPSASFAQSGQAVIPPGQEDLLSRTLIPPSLLLPDGVTVKGLSISRDTVGLTTLVNGNAETATIGLGDPPQAACQKAGRLYVCPPESGASWLTAYAQHLAATGAADEAARAWTQIEAPVEIKPDEPAQESPPAFEAPSSWLSVLGAGLWLLVLWLAWRRARRHPDASGAGLAVSLTMNLALLVQMLAELADRGLGYGLIAGLWGLLWLTWLAHRGGRLAFRPTLHALFASGYAPLLLVFLLAGLLIPVGGGPFSGMLVTLRRAWFEGDALRATLTQLWYAALWLVAALLLLRAAWPERRAALRELLWLLPALALAFWMLDPYLVSAPNALDPDAIYVEWQAPVWLANGALPHFEHYLMGAGALASWMFKWVGLSPDGVQAVREFALLVWLCGVTLAARAVLRSRLAAAFALALAAALPTMPFLATEGWWFMLGAGVALLSLAALERAAALDDPAWGWLALVLAHLAFDIRVEAIVLVPIWLLARAQHGRLSRALDLAAVAVFSLDLLRLLILGAGELRVGAGVTENLARYMGLWAQLWPWWMLSALGLWRLARIAPERAARLALFVLSGIGLFVVSNTVPSQREVLSMFSPLLLACGAFLLTGNPVKPLRRPLSGLILAALFVSLLIYASLPVRREWQGYRLRAETRSGHMQALLERLPRDLPLLLDPIYLRLSQPERRRILESPMSINVERLEAALAGAPEALCVNDIGRADACCFYEIDPGPLDKAAQTVPDFVWGRCWPVRALPGWSASEVGKAGGLTALRLRRSDKNGGAP